MLFPQHILHKMRIQFAQPNTRASSRRSYVSGDSKIENYVALNQLLFQVCMSTDSPLLMAQRNTTHLIIFAASGQARRIIRKMEIRSNLAPINIVLSGVFGNLRVVELGQQLTSEL